MKKTKTDEELNNVSNEAVEVNEAALDVNGDGMLNNKDVSRLMQYLAGWSVDIY